MSDEKKKALEQVHGLNVNDEYEKFRIGSASLHEGEAMPGTEYWNAKGGTDDYWETDEKIEKRVVKKKFGGKEIDVYQRKQPFSLGFGMNFYYDELKTSTQIIDGMIVEYDQSCVLSNGLKMYYDVYRPIDKVDVPIVLSLVGYGKNHWHGLGKVPGLQQAMGVPAGAISKHAAFEGANPEFWVSKGFAVVNADVPGTGYSEGDTRIWDDDSALAGYELIETIAKLSWCNGKVGMTGNSMVAQTQWYTAQLNPPHLAAIAPWEGNGDMYRENICQGGIPAPIFVGMIMGDLRGPGWTDDIRKMIEEYPLINGYWESRSVKLEKIKVPAYITAGYCHIYHLRNQVLGFEKIKSRHKWIRMHREWEWQDYNTPKYIDDLHRFFERYLKGIPNGWELTPRVRLEVTDAYDFDYVTDRPEREFPLARTQYTRFYLNAEDKTLSTTQPEKESKVSYDSESGEELLFDFVFEDETEITGHTKLRLWVEADGSDDMDLFVFMQKADNDGKLVPLKVFDIPDDPGPHGRHRVSHRHLDEEKSMEYLPWHTHDREELLKPGEIVPVDIEIWPSCRIWHKGERLRVSIAGKYLRDESWFIPMDTISRNKGRHIIHTGGKYDAYLLAPIVPPKYQAGDYKYR